MYRSDITLDSENIKTRTIEEWKSIRPKIHKKPSIFLISNKKTTDFSVVFYFNFIKILKIILSLIIQLQILM